MVQHEVERQEPPPGDFNGRLPAVTDVGNSQLAVDGLAEDAANMAAVSQGGGCHWSAGKTEIEKRVNKALRCGAAGSQENLGLVAGEQARVQADQRDPFGLLEGEAKGLQQFFSSFQVRKLHRFLWSVTSARSAWR